MGDNGEDSDRGGGGREGIHLIEDDEDDTQHNQRGGVGGGGGGDKRKGPSKKNLLRDERTITYTHVILFLIVVAKMMYGFGDEEPKN